MPDGKFAKVSLHTIVPLVDTILRNDKLPNKEPEIKVDPTLTSILEESIPTYNFY